MEFVGLSVLMKEGIMKFNFGKALSERIAVHYLFRILNNIT